jgi:lipid A 3-O-deacylase
MRFLGLAIVTSAAVLAAPVLAAEGDGGVWTLAVENDAFGAKTDKNYTSGIKLHYRAEPSWTPVFARGIADAFLGADPQTEVFTTWALGQNIYTPDDTKSPLPLPDQHPYAGWLYGEMGIHAEAENSLTSMTLNLGVVGPSSQAEEVQRFGHDVLNFGDPKGWDNQLRDEFGVVLSLERRWQLQTDTMFGFETDLIPMAGFSIGNVLTEAQAGIQWRIGESLERDWGAVRVRPGNAGPGARSIEGAPSWQVWVGAQARASAVNMFVEGNTIKESLGVDKYPIVYDVEAGASVRVWGVVAAFTYVVRSEEFRGQDGSQNFGVISLTAEL